jgi:hypothetical protein
MSLTNNYLQVYGQLPELFKKIKSGQAPDKFTNQHLKDIGFASTNHRAFIPLLKALGFLTDDGTPTTRYQEFRNNALSKKILGEALKEAYSDIFVISQSPSDADKELIQGKFKSTHNASDRNAELMAKTFYALLDEADIEINSDPDEEETKPEEKVEKADTSKPKENLQIPIKKIDTTLHYNIQIHLPATKDVEVYNAIFKSLKEHLLD